MNVALYPALLCPAWEASPRKGLWGCWHPRRGKSRAAGSTQQTQGGLQGPSRAAGSMGSSCPVPVGCSEVD